MGISGLSRYLQSSATVPSERITLSPVHALCPSQILCVDGDGLYHFLYAASDLDWLHGGQYSNFASIIRQFLSLLCSVGFELHIFLDGARETVKLQTTLSRRGQNARRAAGIARGFDISSLTAQTLEPLWGTAALSDTSPPQSFSKPASPKRTASIIYPILTRDVFKEVLVNLSANPTTTDTTPIRIKLFQCVGEADAELAAYTMSCASACYGVLANDTDFLVFFPPIPRYIPLTSLLVNEVSVKSYASESRPIVYSTVSFTVYNPTQFAESLGFRPALLPLFGCLLGNDFVAGEPIGIAQSRLGIVRRAHTADDVSLVVDAAAQFLHSCQNQQSPKEALAELLNVPILGGTVRIPKKRDAGSARAERKKREKVAEAFMKAIEKYNVVLDVEKSKPTPVGTSGATSAVSTLDSRKAASLEELQYSFVQEFQKHMYDNNIANVVLREEWWDHVCVGEAVANGGLATMTAGILRRLRARLYGVLVHRFAFLGNTLLNVDDPPFVTEYIHTADRYYSPHQAVVAEVPLPLAMTTGEPLDRLLAAVEADIEPSKEFVEVAMATSAPLEPLVAAIGVRWLAKAYATMRGATRMRLFAWEVDAVLAHVALLNKDIQLRSCTPPSLTVEECIGPMAGESWPARAVRLAAAFQHVLNILSCLNQALYFAMGRLQPARLFDGRLFHLCYGWALACQLELEKQVPWQSDHERLVQLRALAVGALDRRDIFDDTPVQSRATQKRCRNARKRAKRRANNEKSKVEQGSSGDTPSLQSGRFAVLETEPVL